MSITPEYMKKSKYIFTNFEDFALMMSLFNFEASKKEFDMWTAEQQETVFDYYADIFYMESGNYIPRPSERPDFLSGDWPR